MDEAMAKFLADGLADNEPDNAACESFCPVKRTPCKFWQDGCDLPRCRIDEKNESPS